MEPPTPNTPNSVRKAKHRARKAWQAVVDARERGASEHEIAQLIATARAARDAWYEARGVTNPHQLKQGRAA